MQLIMDEFNAEQQDRLVFVIFYYAMLTDGKSV